MTFDYDCEFHDAVIGLGIAVCAGECECGRTAGWELQLTFLWFTLCVAITTHQH